MNSSCIKASLALASFALTGIGLVLTGEQALAVETTVPMSARVGSTCTLNIAQPGVLASNPGSPDVMDTRAVGGSAGRLDIDCTGAATITATKVEITGSPAAFALHPTGNPITGWARRSNGDITHVTRDGGISGSITTSSAIDETVNIGISFHMKDGAPLPDGDYAAAVTVSANPN